MGKKLKVPLTSQADESDYQFKYLGWNHFKYLSGLLSFQECVDIK